MTVFAVDDHLLRFSLLYHISNVRFHIALCRTISCRSRIWRSFRWGLLRRHWNEANRCLSQPLVPAGGGLTSAPMRIKVPDVIRNVKIVVHSVYLPFPHINQSCGCGLRQYPRRLRSLRRRSDDGRNVCCSGWAWRLW